MSEKRTKAAAAPAAVQTVAYIGPTFKGQIIKNTIFRGGLPDDVAAFVAAHPVLASLVVGIDDLAAARAALRQPGSALAIIYQKAKEV